MESALDRVLELVALLGADMARANEALGLSPSRMHLLWELGRRGPVTQRVLADALDVTPRAVTGLVDALASSRLVTREPHPTDRRATLVTLTPTGATLVARLQDDHRALARALFEPMSRQEHAAFARGLDEVIASLRMHLATAPGYEGLGAAS
jgi:DNA-binding MarR family transcriptional regulator